MNKKDLLNTLKEFAIGILQLVVYLALWLLGLLAMSAFIAGVSYLIWKYADYEKTIWIYLAFVVLTPVALCVAYAKTKEKIFYYALILGGFSLIPASVLGCFGSSPDVEDDPNKNFAAWDYSIRIHSSEDFQKLTGMEFPEVELVDSFAHEGGAFMGAYRNEEGKFLITGSKQSAKEFRKRIEEASREKNSRWIFNKEDSTYNWSAAPKGEPNNNGDYNVTVPMKGDTITVSTFWQRG